MVEASQFKTYRQYYEDSYLFKTSGNKVLDVSKVEDSKTNEWTVVLDKTILHPQGGGQPDDEGSIQSEDGSIKFNVTGMKVKGDSILHIGNFEQEDKRFEVDQLVDCNVDEAKRRLFARFHSAGHLLDIAMNRAGRTDLKPTKGYHFSSGAYVEYMGNIDADKRDSLCVDLTKHCNDIIKETPADQKVFKKILPYEEGDKELVKAGGAPSYIPKDQEFRVLKLNQEDWGCPCGGTHVEHVHDIQSVNVTKIQKKGKSIRVSYTLPIPGQKENVEEPKPANEKKQNNKKEKKQDKPVDNYERQLAKGDQWLGGQLPTETDRMAYEALKNVDIDIATHPYTFAWFNLVSRFSDMMRAEWKAPPKAKGGKDKGGKQQNGKGKKQDKQQPKKEQAKKEDDDELDLFGEEDEDTKKAAAEAVAKAKEGAKKKKVVIEKSLIIWDVKPWDQETDLDALAKEILKIQQDGLFWKTEYKKEPIAFGVSKLVIGATVEDAKVSTDDLQEKIEALEDYVQSVDIVAFNKV